MRRDLVSARPTDVWQDGGVYFMAFELRDGSALLFGVERERVVLAKVVTESGN